MSDAVRILEPGQMEAPAGAIRFLFLAERNLFSRRADRLRFLSKGHPLRDYLAFLAQLADAQQEALNRYPAVILPDPHEQAGCREQGMPLLDARSRQRDPAWRAGLDMILRKMDTAAPPSAVHETIAALMQAGEAGLEESAGGITAGDLSAVSPQDLPFVAAALQVYWVKMASSFRETAFGRLEHGGICPVCGSHPMAGIVRSGGAEHGLRYLACSLCGSEWHMVRIKCSSCESTEAIDYHILDGSNGSVKAESCGTCDSYLKLFYLGKDPQMDAMADDLATLSLDMLMDKEGKARGGPNLFFHPGEFLLRD